MSLPIVFRHVARQEMDESIAWYENERTGLGIKFANEIDMLLSRIAATPEQFRQVRGEGETSSSAPVSLHDSFPD